MYISLSWILPIKRICSINLQVIKPQCVTKEWRGGDREGGPHSWWASLLFLFLFPRGTLQEFARPPGAEGRPRLSASFRGGTSWGCDCSIRDLSLSPFIFVFFGGCLGAIHLWSLPYCKGSGGTRGQYCSVSGSNGFLLLGSPRHQRCVFLSLAGATALGGCGSRRAVFSPTALQGLSREPSVTLLLWSLHPLNFQNINWSLFPTVVLFSWNFHACEKILSLLSL